MKAKEDLPRGWRLLAPGVYYNEAERRLWIEGDPTPNHDCDAMGCSSISHWTFKATVESVQE